MMGEPVVSGGKLVWRTTKTRLPAITGCQAMMELRPPDQRGSMASGPSSVVRPLRPWLPPELVQSSAAAWVAMDAAVRRARRTAGERMTDLLRGDANARTGMRKENLRRERCAARPAVECAMRAVSASARVCRAGQHAPPARTRKKDS